MFGASLGPRLSPIFHLHLFSCVFLSLPLWSFSSFKSFWYIHMHRYWKRNSPLLKVFYLWMMEFLIVSVLDLGNRYCFCTWTQTAVFFSEPPLVLDFPRWAPGCRLPSLLLCSAPAWCVLASAAVVFQGSRQDLFPSWNPCSSCVCFLFSWALWSPCHFCVLPSGLLNVGFFCVYVFIRL